MFECIEEKWLFISSLNWSVCIQLKTALQLHTPLFYSVLFCFALFCSAHHNHDEFSPSFFSDLINSFEWTNHNACHLAHEISIAIFLFSIAFVSLLFLCIFFARLLVILPHSCKINYTPNFDRVFMSRFLSIFLSFFIFTY